jgi:hypothetical protein
VTAANTSSAAAARATSVATRRSAACSSANPRSSIRACALAIAVAASSVNPASRASVPAGSGPCAGFHGHDTPQAPLNADRHPDPRADAQLAALGGRARGAGEVVDPRRPVPLEHQRGQVPPAEAPPGAEGEGSAGAAPRGDHPNRAIRLIPEHHREVGAQQPPGLPGDRGEHLLRRRRPGRQYRHPPQRGLLPGDPVA